MDMRRVILYAGLALVVYSLWTAWNKDYPPSAPIAGTPTVTRSQGALLPAVGESNASTKPLVTEQPSPATDVKKTSSLIQVKTDVLALTIDSANGDIVNAELLNYPVSVDEPQKPIQLLFDHEHQRYVANSSLFTASGGNVNNIDFNFQSAQQNYQLAADQNELTVTLTGQTPEGLDVKKSFVFKRGSYEIKVNYDLINKSESSWTGYMNTQFLRSSPEEDSSSMFHVGSYTGASYSNPGQNKYKKVSFKDMGKANLDVNATGGWIAMQQHYFLSAWIPEAGSKNVLYTRATDGDYTIGAVSQAIALPSGKSQSLGASLYIGPENTAVLKAIAPGLELTVDYGWLWFLSSLLFSVMKAIHSVVGNWGWSIVLVTVLIKLAFFRLSASSYRSMAGMRQLQPKLLALRERYGDDKARISQATMELYRQEKVNPLGGCLPIVIQIPVFIALYWVLLESVELRQAPFMFWIKDLAAADPYHVLPVIMGLTMLVQQRLNPAPPDPMQAKIMMFLPVLFTALFWNFPSGLVLYWIVNNTLSIIQQWYITRRYSNEQPKKGKKPVLSSVK
ncbi:membrane protein insertase YidC [Legionella sp. CNM-4043-24]|uniref:membrane protein insertase YidC n=1 Tax=Legionella sp. CNM-4043-24 TaxID=3421646 RepID=UPI00403A9776